MSPERISETSDLRIVFRGYDVDQVNELVASLVDPEASPAAPSSPAVAGRSAIERIAEKSKAILMAAHETAEQLRVEAEAHAQTVRDEADSYAANVEAEAEQRINDLTSGAESRTAAAIEEAEQEAERILRTAHADKLDLAEVVEELREHRHALAANVERLRASLLDVEESLQLADEWLDAAETDDGPDEPSDEEDEDVDDDAGSEDEGEDGARAAA